MRQVGAAVLASDLEEGVSLDQHLAEPVFLNSHHAPNRPVTFEYHFARPGHVI